MAEVPENLLYTENHEWVDPASGWAGITDHAQEELGDIVFVELPETGAEVDQGEAFMSVESMKAVSDVYAPVEGKILELNWEVQDNPQYVNEAPYGEGKLVCIEFTGEPEGLMNAGEYKEFLEQQ
ncbi:MAG: glycine cleavage system protein GcvH [bacterium]